MQPPAGFRSANPELPDAAALSGVRDEVQNAELHAALDEALQRLPENQRIAFVWGEFEQLS